MIDRLIRAFLVAIILVATSFAASAQAPIQPPAVANVELPVLITSTTQGAATVNSANQVNTYHKGVTCTLNISAVGGSPSVTMAVQGYDPISTTYQTLGITGAITATGANSLMVYPGAPAASPPTGLTVSGYHVPRRWRVQLVVGGTSTPTITGTTSCGLLN